MQKKAQLQIMENIFAIVIIVIILAIAFVFMVAVDRQEQRSREQDIAALDVVKKSQVLNFLPELKCSDNNNLDPDCYDILKIEAFTQQVSEDNFYYRTLLGNMKIEIVRYDPSPEVNNELKKNFLLKDTARQNEDRDCKVCPEPRSQQGSKKMGCL